MIKKKEDFKLAIIGLGYVGLPLALEFEKKKNVLGFDINERRVKELKSGKDRNLEFSKDQLKVLKKMIMIMNLVPHHYQVENKQYAYS